MKKLIKLIPLAVLAISLTSCGEIITPDSQTETKTTETSTTDKQNDVKNIIEYKITVMLGGTENTYPGNGKLQVILQNNKSTLTAELGEDGTAIIKAPEGEYYARLSGEPGAYVYDPNETVVNTQNREGIINLYSKAKPTGGNGTDRFTNVYTIDNLNKFEVGTTYYYQATIKSQSDVVYYEFRPSVAGTYKIESCVSMYDNLINPKVLKYWAGPVASGFLDSEIDKGGQALDGGFTKNFAFTTSIPERSIGNVQKFGIKADVMAGLQDYPVNITFKITYVGDAEQSYVYREIKYAEDIYYKRDSDGNYLKDSNGNYVIEYEKISEGASETFSTNYTCKDESGNFVHNTNFFNKLLFGDDFSQGIYNYYYKARYSLNEKGEYVLDSTGDYVKVLQLPKSNGLKYTECSNYKYMKENEDLNGRTILDSKKCFLNEKDGIWYMWADDDHTKAYRLFTTFTEKTRYLTVAIDHLEDEGGKGVSSVATNRYTEDGKRIIENYKRLVEAELTDCEDSNGYVCVTDEIKNILNIISNNNQYFFDGNGWCEQPGEDGTPSTYADEDSQWLFACGFYENVYYDADYFN